MTPPRLATRCLERCLPPEVADPLLGDLEEAFEEVRIRRGLLVARLWYWHQAALLGLARRRVIAPPSATAERPLREAPMADVLAEVRGAVRLLRRRPGFTALAVVTLGLGLGATTGVFTIVHGVLLRPLPYPDPERLVRVYETAPPAQGGELRSVAIPTLARWNSGVRAFDGIALYGPESFALTGGERPEQIRGATATASLFSILAAVPMLGRVFGPDEERPGGPLVVVLGHRLWQERFGSHPDVIGRLLRLDREPFTIIGVMPPGFAYPAAAELWVPIGTDHEYDAVAARHMSAIARIARDQTIGSAADDLLRVERELAREDPGHYADHGVRLVSLADQLVGDARPAIQVLAGAVVLVLVLGCVNAASLLLAGAATRRREIALRLALGARRGAVVRRLLIEALLLFGMAGVVGLGLAALIVRGVHGLGGATIPRADAIQVDWRVAAFALGLALVTGLLSGLLPALQASAAAPHSALTEGGRGASGGRRSHRARATLIAVETALTAMLLVGAGLLIRSLQRLSAVDAGLPVERVLTFSLSPTLADGAEPAQVTGFFDRVRDQIAAVPGVRAVALASRLPLSGADHSNGFRLAGESVDGPSPHSAQDRAVSPGYFAAMGIPVLRGREFTRSDGPGTAPVIVINQAFAQRYFPGADPLGQRVRPSRAGGFDREVVGVVGDTRQFGLDVPAEPEFYLSHGQDPWPFMNVAVRTAVEPRRLLAQVEEAVWTIDPVLPLATVRTMEETATAGSARRRLAALSLAGFAVLAYLLAAVGLYGVIAHTVTQRTPELGVRMALGATAPALAAMVIRGGLRLVAIGALAGLAAAVPLSAGLRNLLFGVDRTDPTTYFTIAVLLGAVGVGASLAPAWRAMRVDPVRAIRAE